MREFLFIMRRYGPAAVFTTIALILTLVLGPFHDRFPYVLLAGAVVASALQGGFKPGLFATGMATVAMTLRFLFFPETEAGASVGAFAAQMGLAVFVGLLASYVGEHCWRAVRATEWMQTALGSAGEAVVFTDGDGKITFMNGVAQELTGWGQEIVGTKNLDGIFRIVDADTRLGLPSPLKRAVEGRSATHIPDPTMLLTRTDKERVIMGCITPIMDRDGGVDGTVLVFRDVSQAHQADEEQRRHAERCQAIVASLPAGMLMMDPHGRCIEANRTITAISGTTEQEALGEGWVRNVHPQERETLVVDWNDAIRKGAAFDREVQFVTPKGPTVAKLRAVPVNTAKGIHLGHVGIFEDVKEYKDREAALTQAHETACRQLADQKKQLDELAGRVGQADQQGKERAKLAQQLQEREAELARLRAEVETAKKNYEQQLQQHGQKLGEARKSLQDSEAAFQKKLQEQSAAGAALNKRIEEAQQREKKALKQLEEARKKTGDDSAGKLAELTQERDRLKKDLDLAVERELQAEEAVVRESVLWKNVLDSLEQGVAVWDSRGVLAYMNGAGRTCLGFQSGTPAPDDWASRVSFFAPDGTSPLPPQEVPLFNPKREAFADRELIVKPRDGQRRTLCVGGRPLVDDQGKPIGNTVTFSESVPPKTIVTHDESRLRPLQERLAHLESENDRVNRLHAQTLQSHEAHLRPLHARIAQMETENERLNRLHSEALQTHEAHVRPLRDRLAHIESENERLNRLHAEALQTHEVHVRPLRERLALIESENERLNRLHAEALQTHEAHVRPLRDRLALIESENERLNRLHAQALQTHDAHVRPLQERLVHMETENERLSRLHVEAVSAHELHMRPLRERLAQLENENERLKRAHTEAERRQQQRLRDHTEQTEQQRLIESRLQQELRDARQAADQHYRNGKFNRSLAASVGSALIAVDRDGRVLFVNPAAEQLLGWKETEVHGRNIRGWLLFPSTEDRQAAIERAGHVVRENELFARRDGGLLRVHCSESPLFIDGHIEGTIIAFRLRTEEPTPAEPWRLSAPARPPEVMMVTARPERGKVARNDEWIDYN